MVRRILTLAERWQTVSMSQAGFSNRRVAGKMGVYHSVIDLLLQGQQATGMIDEYPQSGSPRKTTPREDRLIACCARRNRFASSDRIRGGLNFGGHVSVRTFNRRVNEQRMRKRRPIKRQQWSLRHRWAR
jgi:transposase